MATRRQFIVGVLAAAASGSGGPAGATPVGAGLIAAARLAGRNQGACWRDGRLTAIDLPGRGHGVLALSDDRAMIVGRRPGAFAAVLGRDEGEPHRLLAPTVGFGFCGHAAVSPDGGLATSELAAGTYAAAAVRRRADGTEVARWDLPGIEPHDMVFTHDGARLIVAIGGLVHDGGPAGPAQNSGGIDSALVELDAASGRALHRHKLPADLASLSLRHLAPLPDGRIAVAMQDQDLGARRPLLGVLSPGKGIDLLAPDSDDADFHGYAGSIAVDASGDFIAATSPRGGVVGLWSARDGRRLGASPDPDVCGLASGATAGAFWTSSGMGRISHLRASAQGLAKVQTWTAEAAFDNHLLRIAG